MTVLPPMYEASPSGREKYSAGLSGVLLTQPGPWTLGLLAVLWATSFAVLLSGWEPGTYLSITLTWALPAIAPQLAFGADILWHHRRLVAISFLPPTLYLWLVDGLAIQIADCCAAAGTAPYRPADPVDAPPRV